MAGEIFIADKQTLDSVKQDTEYLKTKSGADYVDTNFLHMDGFKGLITKIDNLQKCFEENSDTVTLVEVDGKGYIRHLRFHNKYGQRRDCYVHVLLTIDDVQYKFAAYDDSERSIGAQGHVGFGSMVTTAPYESLDNTNIYEILSTFSTIQNEGFKFNKNCKIQLKKLGKVSDTIHLYINGGVTIG